MTTKDRKLPVPTGNPWLPSKDDPATVPLPLPVVIVKIQGPFTEKDRKLWTFLVHAVWDELETTRIHELSVYKINQVFRECGGDHNTKWIWESAKRLMRTIVEWEQLDGDERYQGIAVLLSYALTHKQARQSGMLRFEFPAGIIPILKDPRRFARLRTHFLIGLSGKYAVTLYELLESVANKVNPILDVQLDILRMWLKVPEGKLKSWDHFNSRALYPAIGQINSNPLGAGFTVEMKPVKKRRAVDRVRFHVKKVDQRLAIEKAMQDGISPNVACQRLESTGSLFNPVHLSTTDYEKAAASAPGWDIYQLESEWREWIAKKGNPEKPGPAFIAFCRKKYQREGRP
jgi:Initiator Replication protein